MPDQITRSIIIGAPVEEVFKVWENFENFPLFMQNIKSVRKIGFKTSHWVMQGPLGKDIEWNAETTLNEPPTRIAWNSINGDVKTSGQVTFTALGSGQTQVTVMLSYIPPAGMAGDVAAKLFSNPENRLEEDLRNFKAYVEDRSETGTERDNQIVEKFPPENQPPVGGD